MSTMLLLGTASEKGKAALPSKDDYDALAETAYLMSTQANASRLMRSLEATHNGEYTEHSLVE
ncbi:type II toxin-antitoxin system Phd/YefM family antitoxin [Nocardia vermiculata]|uniref:type II toxin-antitoxin system Phd/YefM family antitoxin n=1 Tax=Nocardia vermiculata TaxID=257274 RepID=UPI000A64E5FA|nr:hypothetical protein [Nocardia vermiculata]